MSCKQQNIACNVHNACTDNAEDESDSEDEQDVFALEGKTGQEHQEHATQSLDEAAADPNISRGGWEGAAATQVGFSWPACKK